MSIRIPSALSILSFLAAAAAAEDGNAVHGRVETRSGTAIEHALVYDIRGGGEVYTDHGGNFAIECELPCLLLVTHSRFLESPVEVLETPGEPLLVALQAKQEVYEEIVVSASRGGDAFAPVAIASTVVHADQKTAPPSTLTELVEGVPGVAENGQGGIFQVFSIRGVSRQRVMTLVDGMRVTAERRAGVSTSFLDPLLMGSVDVLRGPASTHYGSGALGGVVQVFPREFESPRVALGYDSYGDETYQVLGWGDGDWSLGLARRSRSNDTAADGTLANDRFTQVSASIARTFERDGLSVRILALPSLGSDIGKSNTDFPERTTIYPDEEHLFLKLGVASASGWSLDAWGHPNNLVTEVEEGTSLNRVTNDAVDLGLSFQRELSFPEHSTVSGRYGFDYVGRRGVEAVETDEDFAAGTLLEQQTLDGEQDEAALFTSLSWTWGDALLQGGARVTWQQQSNRGTLSRDDSAVTGFLGIVQPLKSGVEVVANLGTGLRFPNLSERFFTGTTGRGQVLGNPDLIPERSWNVDLGVRRYGKKVFVAAQVFRLEIDNYIERVDLTDELRTFVNLNSGAILGLELEGFFQPNDRWQLSWSGHLLDGEDDGKNPLSDVPSDRLQLGLRFREGRWESRLTCQYRAEKDDPGSGEKPIGDVHLVSFALGVELSKNLRLTLQGSNLLDDVYFSSADRRSPVAAGRSVGLGLVWGR